MRYRARRPAAHRPVAVGRVDVGIGQNAARLTAVFGRNNRLNNMYFTPSEDPVTPSSSPVMWGYATTLGVHMPMVHLADSSQTKIAAQKQPKIAYFTPPGQIFFACGALIRRSAWAEQPVQDPPRLEPLRQVPPGGRYPGLTYSLGHD